MILQLLGLQNLNHLALDLFGQSIDLRYLIVGFSSMQSLQCLQLIISNEDALHCLIHDLHNMKNLTSLYLIHTHDLQNDFEPNSCVQGLSQLEISHELLVNRRGELIFPMLSGLTSLDIYGKQIRNPLQFPPNLQVCQRLHSSV